MTQSIRFRAKNKKTGEWFYWSLKDTFDTSWQTMVAHEVEIDWETVEQIHAASPSGWSVNWKAVAVEKLRREEYPNGSIIRIINDLSNIVDYVLTTHTAQLVERVEAMKLKESDYVLNMGVAHNPPSNTTRTNLTRNGYNHAIDDILEIIKKGV